MGEPNVRLEVLELVIGHVVLSIANQLEHQQIAAVGEHEGPLFAQRCVEGVVQPVGVAPDEFVLQLARRHICQPCGFAKGLQDIRFDPGNVAMHVGRTNLQSDIPVLIDVILTPAQGHVEVGQDEVPFDLRVHCRIEQGNLNQVVRIESLAVDTDLFRHQPDCGDPAALAVAAILHLHGRLVDESSANGNRAGKPGYAAAAFFRCFALWVQVLLAVDLRACRENPFG